MSLLSIVFFVIWGLLIRYNRGLSKNSAKTKQALDGGLQTKEWVSFLSRATVSIM